MSNDLPLPELPQEIIPNILVRLPVKSLLKFKSVSKPWLSLISSPPFAKLQLQQMKLNNSATSRVFMSNLQSFSAEAYSDDTGDHGVSTLMQHHPISNLVRELNFVGSVDGLICGTSDYNRHMPFIVFNPTTRQVRRIPKPIFVGNGRCFSGFGFDSKIDDYKIVRGVIFSFFNDGFCIEILNLKGNSWRTVQPKHWCGDSFDKEGVLLGGLFAGDGVFLNGVLHWLSDRNDIIRFDFIEECFLDAMSIPSHVDCAENLTVIDGRLCLYALGFETFSASKLVNYDDHNSWSRIYQITNTDFPEDLNGFLCVTKNGHLLFDVDSDYQILYNPENEEIKQIGDEADDCVVEKSKIVYIESLVSPNAAD